MLDSALQADGYADLGTFLPNNSSLQVAKELGAALRAELVSGIHSLTVNGPNDKPKNTYGGNYGYGPLPLHSDLAHWSTPPRYVMLRCVVPDGAILTRLLHRRVMLEALGEEVLRRALFRPRRRLSGKSFLVRALREGIFRWDPLFLTPDNDEANALCNFMLAHSEDKAAAIRLDEPSRTLLIDNWHVLHGRSAAQVFPSPRLIDRAHLHGVTR